MTKILMCHMPSFEDKKFCTFSQWVYFSHLPRGAKKKYFHTPSKFCFFGHQQSVNCNILVKLLSLMKRNLKCVDVSITSPGNIVSPCKCISFHNPGTVTFKMGCNLSVGKKIKWSYDANEQISKLSLDLQS